MFNSFFLFFIIKKTNKVNYMDKLECVGRQLRDVKENIWNGIKKSKLKEQVLIELVIIVGAALITIIVRLKIA